MVLAEAPKSQILSHSKYNHSIQTTRSATTESYSNVVILIQSAKSFSHMFNVMRLNDFYEWKESDSICFVRFERSALSVRQKYLSVPYLTHTHTYTSKNDTGIADNSVWHLSTFQFSFFFFCLFSWVLLWDATSVSSGVCMWHVSRAKNVVEHGRHEFISAI